MEKTESLHTYKYFKTDFGTEKYSTILSKQLRICLSKLRMSSHNLRIEAGRYGRNKIIGSERYCLKCNTHDIEDEYHFILICPLYSELRNTYVKKYYVTKPSFIKFCTLMSSKNHNEIKKLAVFVKKALSLRNLS